jgi:hypothetical protein
VDKSASEPDRYLFSREPMTASDEEIRPRKDSLRVSASIPDERDVVPIETQVAQFRIQVEIDLGTPIATVPGRRSPFEGKQSSATSRTREILAEALKLSTAACRFAI